MAEVFVNSGDSEVLASAPSPVLQGSFIPGIDIPDAQDGFGLVTPLGGGATTRRYGDYGISAEVSAQNTQLNALSFGGLGGGYVYDLGGIGEQGLRGFPGPRGLPGITTVIGLPAYNSNFLTDLPHNLDSINDLGTASDKLVYTSAYTTYYKFTWVRTSIAAIKSWNDSAINTDASVLFITADAGIYISTDDGDSWSKKNPDSDTYIQGNCQASGGKAIVLGTANRDRGAILITSNYGIDWTEKTVTV